MVRKRDGLGEKEERHKQRSKEAKKQIHKQPTTNNNSVQHVLPHSTQPMTPSGKSALCNAT